jgi:lipopolysaccharide heptosyltransferase III
MSDRSDLETDCRHFRWDRPCAPHKAEGVTCPDCTHHDPVQTRLLITKLAAVGDVLRTTSFLAAIRKKYPGASITWVTSPAARELVEGNALVDHVWMPDDPRLRRFRFDVVLGPDADPQTAAIAGFVAAGTKLGYTAADSGEVIAANDAAEHWFRMGIDDARKKRNTETYQSLVAKVLELDPAGVTEPILEPSDQDHARARAVRASLAFDGHVVGINTGAGSRWERKRWDVDHQQRLVEMLAERGIGVLLLGGPEEAGTHQRLIPDSPKSPVISAGTDHNYHAFAALVEQCDVLVTGDTLALHVACARRVPIIALFGPTSTAEIELYGRGEKIVPEDLPCLGCYLPTCDVDPHCQQLIDPSVVLAAVQRQLPRPPT